MAPADNIRQRDQRVIRKFEKKKGRHRKMKKNVKRLIAGAVVLLVAAGIVVRIAGGNKKEEEYETRPTVAVENPKTGDITLYTDLTGTIEPISKAVVQPKIGGELLEVNFQAGDQVEAGQVLCKIDSDALTALQLQMQSASVAADNAARELARIQPLYASGYISQQQFDQAQSSATSAQLAYESAKNQYDLQVEYTTVTAPISGVIESRNVEPHDHIGTDTKICVISGGDQLQVKFGVTEKILRNMKVNDPVQVEKNGTDYEGNVTEIGSMVNSATGLYDAKAFVNNAESLTSGTKVKLAMIMDKHDTIGIDAVAMCVNDIACAGGEPLFFLDYIACGKNYPEKIAQIVSGVAEGCVQSDAALIGGETAEHPGLMPEEEYDLAGFAVGVCDRKEMITGENLKDGDVLIGMASTGVHSNGFSLVRKVFDMTKESLDTYYDELGTTLGEALLAPTRIYVKALKNVKNAGVTVKACSHITGGGFYENIPRMLKDGVHAVIEKDSYPIPPIFTLMAKKGDIAEQMMYNTYNMGIGMIVAVDPADVDKTMEAMRAAGDTPYVVGKITEGEKGVTLC